MGLILAVKRVNRLYDVSPRRWVRNTYDNLLFYAIGLMTGCDVYRPMGPPPLWHMGIFLGLLALKFWAGDGESQPQIPAA